MLDRWREREVFRESVRRREGAPAVGLLRGPADGERPAGHAPRPRPRLQGHLPPLPHDARVLRRAQGRLGLPWPARSRSRSRRSSGSPARTTSSATASPSSTSSAASRCSSYLEDWDRLTERIGFWVDLDHAYRTLDPDLHRVGVVGAAHDLGQRPAVRGPQGRPLLPALTRPRSPRTRSRSGYQDVVDPQHLRALPDGGRRPPLSRATCCSCGPRRRGRSSSNAAVAVDPDLLYVRARKGGEVYVVAEALMERVLGEDAELLDRFAGRELVGTRYDPPFPFLGRAGLRGAGPHRAARATSSPPRTAPASSTRRSPSARTTSASASSTA